MVGGFDDRGQQGGRQPIPAPTAICVLRRVRCRFAAISISATAASSQMPKAQNGSGVGEAITSPMPTGTAQITIVGQMPLSSHSAIASATKTIVRPKGRSPSAIVSARWGSSGINQQFGWRGLSLSEGRGCGADQRDLGQRAPDAVATSTAAAKPLNRSTTPFAEGSWRATLLGRAAFALPRHVHLAGIKGSRCGASAA